MLRALVIAALVIPSSVSAQDDLIDYLIIGTIQGGGEEVSTLDVNNGSRFHELRMGDAFSVNAGLEFGRFEYPVTVQASIGYSYANLDGYDGRSSVERTPVELIPHFNFGMSRIGLGGVYHINPQFEAHKFGGESFIADLDDSFGWIVTYDFQLNESWALGVRHVNIEYDADFLIEAIDANSTGAHIIMSF